MTISGNGNTTINGGIIALSAAFDHILIKSGTGTLTLTGTTSTLDGAVNVNGGTVAISDWRAITNNTSTVSVGSTTTAAILSIVGNNLTLANLTTSKVINLAGTTGAATILANQTGTSPGVIFNADFTATGAGAKTLFLGGANVGANTINGAIVNNTGTFTTALTKIDAGRWILAGTNSYTGATTIANGTLQLKANAAASTILADTSAIIFNQVNQYAGGTLELIGQASTNNVETLGALTPTLGSGTVRLTPGSGGTASIVFASLGTVGGGASVNLVAPTSSDTFSFATTSITNNIANAGLYYNGSDFAYVPGAGLAVRAPIYGVDADFATTATALTAARSMEITGAGFTNGAVTIDSLRINGATALNMTGLLTIRTAGTTNASGGIIQTGGSGSISGTGVSTGGSGALVINVDGGANTLQLDAPITSTTTGGFTKVGAGTLRLGAANAQTGTISINEGTVRLTTGGRLGAASAALAIRQDGILELNGITPATATGAFNNNGIVRNTSATTDVTFTVGGGNGTGVSNGIIENGGPNLVNVVKVGTGGQSWLGLSTYTGTTTIGSTGIVIINNLAIGGMASGIGASSSAAGNLIFDGASATQAYGGLNFTGTTNDETDRLFTFNGGANGGARIQSNGINFATSSWTNTGTLAFGVNATGNAQGLVLGGGSTGDNRFSPIITDNGAAKTSLYKSDAGVWYLGATNTYSGVTQLNAGTLYAQDGTNIKKDATTGSNIVFNGGNFAATGAFNRTIGTAGDQMQWGATASGGFSAGGSSLTVDWGTGNVWGTTAGFLGTGALLLNNSGVAKSDVDVISGFEITQGAASAFNATTTAASATVTLTSGTTAGWAIGQEITGNAN
ncbi:MAG TPA: autotransporter-associated beta strand repeat-containing protein, partial [Verrucomicrobiales bacterium]|nr:autotransporter-associated beta strand repeat-containing protein [Verrucomicrobiales bacterium]